MGLNLADRLATESRENLALFPLIYNEIGIGENAMKSKSKQGKRIEYEEGQMLGDYGVEFVRDVETKNNGRRKALMKCHCGKEFESCISDTKNNSIKSCGCIQGKKQTIKYSKGQLIGDNGISFIKDIPNNRDSKIKKRMAIFKCICGEEFEACIEYVKNNYHTRCSRRCANFISIYENGQTLGDYGIKFLEEIDTKSNEFRKAKFKCHCGNEFITKISSVKNNNSKSCGCEQNRKRQYTEGQKVGSYGFIFIKDIGDKLGSERKALVKCHCGKEYISKISPIANDHTKSCGCTYKRPKQSNYERTCIDCGKTFYGGPRAKYCVACRTQICSICGKEFIVKQKKKDNEWSEYCSRKCAGEAQKGRASWSTRTVQYVIVECKHCGKEMEVKDWKRKRKFCSRACSGAYYSARGSYKRSDNPTSWRKIVFHTPEYKKWRKSVLIRDGGICRECWDKKQIKNRKELVAHHIVPLYADKSRVFDVDNGITLCKNCHLKTLNHEAEFSDYYFSVLKMEPIKVEKQWFKEINPYLILRKWELGYTQKQVAAHFGVCVPTIQKRLGNKELAPQSERIHKPKGATFYTVLQLAEQGYTHTEIGKMLKTDTRNVLSILEMWGLPTFQRKKAKRAGLTSPILQRLLGMDATAIANKFGTHVITINRLQQQLMGI